MPHADNMAMVGTVYHLANYELIQLILFAFIEHEDPPGLKRIYVTLPHETTLHSKVGALSFTRNHPRIHADGDHQVGNMW